jgi:hypothetical protein
MHTPLTPDRLQAPPQKVPKPHHVLDDAKHRLDGGLAFGIQRLAFGGTQAVFPPHDRIRCGRGFTGVSKAFFQGGMMLRTPVASNGVMVACSQALTLASLK